MSTRLDPILRGAALDLLAGVKYAKDDEDVARFGGFWTHDARLAIITNGQDHPPIVGRAAILEFYRGVWETGGHGKGATRETHLAEHPDLLRQDDGTLLARHCSVFLVSEGGAPALRGFGSFIDILAEEDGMLRIAWREARLTRS